MGRSPEGKAAKLAYQRQWRADNPEKVTDYNAAYQQRQKRKLMDALGGVCACCGERELAFLTLDHIGGNVPSEHFKADGKSRLSAKHLFKLIEAKGFPRNRYRVLCFNCNVATAHGRTCPHELAREATA
ncbi:MAG: hypothetical protein ABW167_19520 [Baekduia sp.]